MSVVRRSFDNADDPAQAFFVLCLDDSAETLVVSLVVAISTVIKRPSSDPKLAYSDTSRAVAVSCTLTRRAVHTPHMVLD